MATQNKILKTIDVLNAQHQKDVKEYGTESINPKNFPEAYRETAIRAMQTWSNINTKPLLKTLKETADILGSSIVERKAFNKIQSIIKNVKND